MCHCAFMFDVVDQVWSSIGKEQYGIFNLQQLTMQDVCQNSASVVNIDFAHVPLKRFHDL